MFRYEYIQVFFLLLSYNYEPCEANEFLCTINPICVSGNKLIYNLYNAKFPGGTTDFTFGDMNKSSKTVFILQGFFENIKLSDWPLDMIDAYLAAYPGVDVIHMDWSFYSQIKFPTATPNARKIGEHMGTYVSEMILNEFDPKMVHFVGFSLGGHIAGFAAQTVKKLTNKKIGKITGLDIVGVGFYGVPADGRLSRDDADDVIGIHTNGLVNGIITPYGRVDFYINGGLFQPDCVWNFFKVKLSIVENAKKLFCSHLTAPQIKIRSLRGEVFMGNNTSGVAASISEDVDPRAKGSYKIWIK